MCASRFSTCCIAIWATTSTGRRRCSGRWWPRGGWGGRAAAVSMSIAIEATGLSETQRQIVDLAREFARTRIEPHAAEHTSELQSLAYLVCRLLLEKKKLDKA